jgi:acyl-CoA thioesterase-1
VRIPPNYGIEYTQQFQQVYQNLQAQNDMKVVPLFLKNVDDDPSLMQSDGIHPKENAQKIMLNNVWPTLQTLLK